MKKARFSHLNLDGMKMLSKSEREKVVGGYIPAGSVTTAQVATEYSCHCTAGGGLSRLAVSCQTAHQLCSRICSGSYTIMGAGLGC